MKIAVIGCGAVGSYYGARLGRSGQEVHFLLRSDYEAVRRKGVQILSPEGDFCHQPKCVRTPGEIGPVDLVLIGLKTTANAELSRLLPPLVGPETSVLTLQNGLGNEELLAGMIGAERVLGGLCFVCLNRLEPGVIRHLAHGTIVMGEFNRWPEPRTHDLASMIRHSGVPCKVTDNLAAAHWEKLAWNIPFNGLGVAAAAGYEAVAHHGPIPAPLGPCLSTDRLLADPRWELLIRDLIAEVAAAAAAEGHKLRADLEQRQIERTRQMGAYQASTLLDFEQGRPLELESLFLEPLRRAQRGGVATPRLERLCGLLAQMDPAKRAGDTANKKATD